MDAPCVLFALHYEAHRFLRVFRPRRRVPGAPVRAWWCERNGRSVLVLETGIGPDRAAAAVAWLLEGGARGAPAQRPPFVLAAGFAGGLQPGLGVGAVVTATEVTDGQGQVWPVPWPTTVRLRSHPGRLLSVPRLVGCPHEKQALGQRHQALAVDMETATVARLCAERGVPLGCLRVISDDAHTRLAPQLVTLLSGERISPLRTLLAVGRSPGLTSDLWRLARQTRRAAQVLGVALADVLCQLHPWS